MPAAEMLVPSWERRNIQAPSSPAVNALAERTRIRPEAIAELADASGEVPKSTAARLERGVEAAGRIAKRIELDESQSQNFVTLVTHGIFSLLREELSDSPGPAFEAQPLLDDVRAFCGEDAAIEAEALLAEI